MGRSVLGRFCLEDDLEQAPPIWHEITHDRLCTPSFCSLVLLVDHPPTMQGCKYLPHLFGGRWIDASRPCASSPAFRHRGSASWLEGVLPRAESRISWLWWCGACLGCRNQPESCQDGGRVERTIRLNGKMVYVTAQELTGLSID